MVFGAGVNSIYGLALTNREVLAVVTYRDTIEAGALIRGGIRRNLEEIKFLTDANFEWQETKWFFESRFLLKATGTQEQIDKVKGHLRQMARHYS